MTVVKSEVVNCAHQVIAGQNTLEPGQNATVSVLLRATQGDTTSTTIRGIGTSAGREDGPTNEFERTELIGAKYSRGGIVYACSNPNIAPDSNVVCGVSQCKACFLYQPLLSA